MESAEPVKQGMLPAGERRSVERPLPDFNELEAATMKGYGNMAGFLFILGSAGAIPSSLIFARTHDSPDSLLIITLVGVLSGIVCLAAPWERYRPAWLLLVGGVALIEVTLVTYLTAQHYAVLYFLIAAYGAYVFRPAPLVGGLTVACLATMFAAALLGESGQAHAIALSLVFASTLIALSLAIYQAREHAQRERMRASHVTAEVLRVALSLELGHGRVASTVPTHRRSEMIETLDALDAFRLALKESLVRIDVSPVLDLALMPRDASR